MFAHNAYMYSYIYLNDMYSVIFHMRILIFFVGKIEKVAVLLRLLYAAWACNS